jgi:hypothetical protein
LDHAYRGFLFFDLYLVIASRLEAKMSTMLAELMKQLVPILEEVLVDFMKAGRWPTLEDLLAETLKVIRERTPPV